MLQEKVTGPYRPIRLLGEGGAARTWLAIDTRTNTRRAIKELQLLKTSQNKQIELFERECATLKELQHPQIPRFIETIVEGREETMSLFLVQECVEGRSLQQLLDAGVVFDANAVVAILRSCLVPLAYLHARTPPLFHRDIKPSNVLLRSDGQCVLVDFGAVREALADPKAGGSSVVGTFGYMAPEQFQARAFRSTDLYALGATAIHLLTGIEPARFEVRRLKPDFHERIGTDSHLVAILDLLLEPAAEDRYQSVDQLSAALERWQQRNNKLGAPQQTLLPIITRALEDPEPSLRHSRSSASAHRLLTASSTPPPILPAVEAKPTPAAAVASAAVAPAATPAAVATKPAPTPAPVVPATKKVRPQAPTIPPVASATGAVESQSNEAPRRRGSTVPVVNRTASPVELLVPGGLGANAAGLLVLLLGGLIAGYGFFGGMTYNAIVWQTAGGLLAAWGLLLAVVPRRSINTGHANLRQRGLATQPELESIERVSSILGQTEWIVRYDYRGDDDLHHAGQFRLPSAKMARQLADDPSGVTVRFDPNDASASVLVMIRPGDLE